MNKNKVLLLTALAFCALPLQGCSNVSGTLGLEKESPDEFSVITRAPLEMPSNIALPPPNLGTPRPQEQTTIKQARSAVFGDTKESSNQLSSSENILLQKTGANNVEPNIRSLVNNETKNLENRNKPVAEKLLNISGNNKTPSATVVDAKKELERIQSNKKSEKNITDGKTHSIEE